MKKTYRPLFNRSVLALSVAVAAGALWGAAANAQTTLTATTTASTSTSSTTTTTTTSALVTVNGIVSGSPESVSFSGQAQLSANVVTDPDFGSTPSVVLSIDLSNITGVGSSTGKKYVISNQEIITRKLAAADAVQMTFPFSLNSASTNPPGLGLASFNLSFDVITMKLTGASGNIASPQ